MKVPNKIFVRPEKQEDYCRAHQIELRNLPNGIIIVGITREVADLAQASINFTFPSGAFFDPPGKSGLHHLAEHLLNKEIREPASHLNVDLNAITYPLQTKECSFGPINPQVRDFGLWPILPKIRKVLISPLPLLKNPKRVIEKEKRVIQAEITENQAKHDWQADRFLKQIVFDSLNPTLVYPPGTVESLTSITLPEVRKLVEEVFIPKGLIISVFNEGRPEVCRNLTDYLVRLWKDFPKKGENQQINWSSLEKLNSDFKAGQIQEKDTGLKNGLISLLYVWTFQSPLFTPLLFALSHFVRAIHYKFFSLSRKKGWSYTAYADFLRPGWASGVFFLRLDLPKSSYKELKKFIKKAWPEIKKFTIAALGPKEMRMIIWTEQKRQVAVPLMVDVRLDWLLLGLSQWRKLIDADQIRNIHAQINPHHLQTWQEKFLSETPAVVIVGDLS